MKKIFFGFCPLLLGLAPLHAVSLKMQPEGILVGNGAKLKFVISYPILQGANSKENHKLYDKSVGADSATLKYEGGATAVVSVSPEGSLRMEFADVPADVRSFGCSAQLGFGWLNEGGQWRADEQAFQPFPEAKPSKPHLFQGQAKHFALQSQDGGSLSFSLPGSAYHELLDGRIWNWKNYTWKFSASFDLKKPVVIQVDSKAPASAAPPAPKVDPFGQSNKKDWPDKVKTVEELKADAESDAAYYASFKPPETGRYGGYPGTKEKYGLKATGFFHVEKAGGRWFMVDPEGNAFFHLGMGGFALPFWTYVEGRRDSYEWLPPFEGEFQTAYLEAKEKQNFSFYCANWIRKYGKPFSQEEFTAEMIRRVRLWGFNSNGYFSGKTHQAYKDLDFPYVAGLATNEFPAVPGLARTFDPFSEEGTRKFEEKLAVSLAKNAENPLVIGYFMGNEPILEDIPRVVPSLKGNQPCKQRLVGMLREKYGSIDRLNAAWNLQAKTFEELQGQALPVSTPQASADMKEYTELFVDKLYGVVSAIFRKYDKNHLLIGNRLQYGTINNEMVCRIMGKYLDVVSFNYYTYAFDGEFLKKVHQWTGGKPMILSEFAWNAPDSGLGGPKDLESQEQRGLAYRNYVEQAAALGFVVGTEWYQLIDEPLTGLWWGKYSGPNGNNGMIAVTDRPWKKMVENVSKGNYNVRDIVLSGREPFVYDHPVFKLSKGGSRVVKIPRATGPIKMDGSMKGWPGLPAELLGSNLVQGANPGSLSATFKVCWDDRNFYFWAHVVDPIPMKNGAKGASLYQGDGIELFFGPQNLDETGPLLPTDRHIALSANSTVGPDSVYFVGQAASLPCEMTVIPDVDGGGYTLEAAIPFTSLGFTPKEGTEVRFDIALNDSETGTARTRQFMWNGTSRNSKERKDWGRAVFNP